MWIVTSGFWAAVTRSGSWNDSITSTPSNVSYPNMMRMTVFFLSEYSIIFWTLAVVGVLILAHYLPRVGLGIFVLLLSNFLVTLWAAEFSSWNLDLLGYLSLGSGLAVLTASTGLLRALVWLFGRRPQWSTRIGWAAPVLALTIGLLAAEKNWGLYQLNPAQASIEDVFANLTRLEENT